MTKIFVMGVGVVEVDPLTGVELGPVGAGPDNIGATRRDSGPFQTGAFGAEYDRWVQRERKARKDFFDNGL